MKGFLKIAGITLGVVLVSAIAVGAFVVVDYINRFNADAVALEDAPEVEPPSISAFPGEFSVLLIGTDECGEVSGGLLGERCSEADGGILNDVNLLVHVSAEPRNVTVVSLPRDLMIETPECTREDGSIASATSKTQINSIYQNAGLSCVAKTITDLSGVEIPFAAKIDFDGVMAITDAIGGVEVCIGGDGIRDEKAGIDYWAPGPRTVSGYEALQFIRTRYGVGDGSDMARVSNQQQYMSRLANKLKSQDVLSNPATLYKLASTALHNVEPSTSLTNPLTLVQIAMAVKDVPFNDIVFVQYPTFTDPSDPNRVVPDKQSAAALWAALAANEPIQLSGRLSDGDGVVADKNAATPAPTSTSAAPSTPTPTKSTPSTPAPSPSSTTVQLPIDIAGQTAAQSTCANGNVR